MKHSTPRQGRLAKALTRTSAWLAACIVALPVQAAQVTIFTGARLIDGTGQPPLENATLVVERGRILAVGEIDPAPYAQQDGAQEIDCRGMTIMPGLITDHSHLGLIHNGVFSPKNYTKENIRQTLKHYEGYGVTTVMSLGMNQDLLYELRDEQRAGGLGGADIFTADRGIGVPDGAPPVPAPAFQLMRVSTPQEARDAVRAMAARKPDAIKLWDDNFFGSTKKMPSEIYEAVIDEARKNGLPVASHLFYLADAKSLVSCGVNIVAHSVRDQPVDEELIARMKQQKTAYIPTLTLDEAQFIYAEHPAWMNDPAFRAAADPKLLEQWLSQEYVERMRANPLTPKNKAALAMALRNVKTLHDAGVLVGFGTDSGATPTRLPGWGEHRELQLLVQAGLTPMEAIVCATRNAAKVLGDLKNRGTLEPGKSADFLLLSANPLEDIRNTTRLAAIYHNGKRVEPAFSEGNEN